MKNLILTLTIVTASLCSQAQKFYTADSEVVPSSIYAFTRIAGDTIVVDSTRLQINCWFGQVNNPYVDSVSHAWCQFNQITQVIKGNPKSSYYLNSATRFCELYRRQRWPNITQ